MDLDWHMTNQRWLEAQKMKITVISDTHTFHNSLHIEPTDFLIHCGDYTNTGTVPEFNNFLNWFERQPAKHKIFINGNHEVGISKLGTQWIKSAANALGIHYLEDSVVVIDGIKFYGSPRTPEFCDWAYMYPSWEAERIWDIIPIDTDVLITHGPAYGKLDQTPQMRTGCAFLRDKIKSLNLKYHLCGHIHEGYGIDGIHVNAACCNEFYVCENPPIVLEI